MILVKYFCDDCNSELTRFEAQDYDEAISILDESANADEPLLCENCTCGRDGEAKAAHKDFIASKGN